MNLRDLFNFEACLNVLHARDWHGDPYACVVGAPLAGKTRLLQEFMSQQVAGGNLVLGFDAREHRNEASMVGRAVAAARADELARSRMRLSSGAAQVVVGGTFNESSVNVRLGSSKPGRWFTFWRPRPIDARPTGALFPDLVADIDGVQRDVWIVLDHGDEATDSVAELTSNLAQRLHVQPRLRMLTVTRDSYAAARATGPHGLGGLKPDLIALQPLGVAEIQKWARDLGLDLGDGDVANALHSISQGQPGVAWSMFAKLLSDRAWTARSTVT